MTEQAKSAPTPMPQSNNANSNHRLSKIKGRLEQVKQQVSKAGETYFKNYITIPAADEFSHPQNWEVLSKQQIGQANTTVELVVEFQGRVRYFEYTDRNTGIRQQGQKGEFTAWAKQ